MCLRMSKNSKSSGAVRAAESELSLKTRIVTIVRVVAVTKFFFVLLEID